MRRLITAVTVLATFAVATVLADEGMWTFDNFPRATVQQKYGVAITDEWLNRLQQSVVRLETGCTGSFVSNEGLILTNHHCVSTCLADNSTAESDLLAGGFTAGDRSREVRCQGAQASVLMDTEDVTARVTMATVNVPAAQVAQVRNQTLTQLETECEAAAKQAGTPLACEVVTLYQGGQYWLYKYKRYDDVRLVFAPEHSVAAFGGDPDNFQFPRWCLDMALLRAYENDKPAPTPTYLNVNWNGANEGDPVFVAGHPGTTQRLMTTAQLKTQRDLVLPFWLIRYSELRGRLIQYSKTSEEAARQTLDYLGTIENSIKVRRQQLFSLLDDRMMAQHEAQEQKLREAVAADPTLASVRDAWDVIARAEQRNREIHIPWVWTEGAAGFNSDLFFYARALVRAAEERTRPNAERLREYTEAALPQVRAALAAQTPVYDELEKVKLSFSLERMREFLGPDHPVVRQVLGAASPDEKAAELIEGSDLADPAVRLRLFDGGQAAIEASTDPMIRLARQVDAESRRLRAINDTEIVGPIAAAQQRIAEARFKAFGTGIYPDATFTLRLSYGAVRGWNEAGTPVPPFTELGRMYERVTGAEPFALPQRWLDARSRLDLSTRANFVTTNDIVGGNSGSPMVNAAGQIVGLIFDGNIHSIAGSYWFDEEMNRAVAVHPQWMRVALQQVYQVEPLVRELNIPAR